MNNRGSIFSYGITYILLIPIGLLLILLCAEKGYEVYTNKTLNKDAKSIFKKCLDTDNMYTEQDMATYILKEFEAKEYDKEKLEIDVIINDDYFYLKVSKKYTSFVNDLKYDLTSAYNDIMNKKKKSADRFRIATIRLKGTYNENKETVITEFTEEDEELFFEASLVNDL